MDIGWWERLSATIEGFCLFSICCHGRTGGRGFRKGLYACKIQIINCVFTNKYSWLKMH
ncbi:hypothetical protein D1BOALGB6SA_2375 [Olavius sp. associated proteobacterium Delta 1]|nr:hypothetical protein D1BOALGB6SA_2375 [Olavius sp. associated proteobacterium Delta 1]